MIVRSALFPSIFILCRFAERNIWIVYSSLSFILLYQENPARANGHIFNVGNPNNEVTVRQLAEMMTEVKLESSLKLGDAILKFFVIFSSYSSCFWQVYSNVSGEPSLEAPTVDVSSKEFYGEGYDDSDKRIPDMTIINRQLGITFFDPLLLCLGLEFLRKLILIKQK